jgi:hypothetical protein
VNEVSNSQIKTWKRCRRKYWLAYVRRLRKKRLEFTGARQLGTRVHAALQCYYEKILLGESAGLEDAIACLEQIRDDELAVTPEDFDETRKEITKEHDMAVAMVEGYFQWLEDEGSDVGLQILGVEEHIECESPVPSVKLIGKLDLRGMLASAAMTGGESAEGFVDFKTVGSLDEPLKTLPMDEQFRMYALIRRVLGGEPVRLQRYRMLKKSKRTARAKPPFFRDYDVYVSDAELRQFWNRLYCEIMDMLEFERRCLDENEKGITAVAYPTPAPDCTWSCDFFHVCPLFDDPHADPEHLLMTSFEECDPHEHHREPVSPERDTVSTEQGGEA